MEIEIPSFLLKNFSYIRNKVDYLKRICKRRKAKARKGCRYYTSPSLDSTHIALQGVHSHWVTDEILATASLCDKLIKGQKIIKQFKSLGITSIINLQRSGEYSNCGCRLGANGFTYEPTQFMENKIYYFNYQWKEWEEIQVKLILDMVKVVCFTIQEGKVAIHCNDGLGRTAALIACYLIFSQDFTAENAIKFVKMKRPDSLEEAPYLVCIEEFEKFVKNHNYIFQPRLETNDGYIEFCLSHHLHSQQLMLYGDEARQLRHVPKILFMICETILSKSKGYEIPPVVPPHNTFLLPTTSNFLSFSNLSNTYHRTILHNIYFKKKLMSEGDQNLTEERFINSSRTESLNSTKEKTEDNCLKKGWASTFIVEALLTDSTRLGDGTKTKIQDYMMDLNYINKTWSQIKKETELKVLTGLLYEWLETLQSPVITKDGLTAIVINGHRPEVCLRQFDQVTQFTLEYLFRFLERLEGIKYEDKTQIMMRFVAALTHRKVRLHSSLTPGRNFQILQKGTSGKLLEFFTGLLALVKEVEKKESS